MPRSAQNLVTKSVSRKPERSSTISAARSAVAAVDAADEVKEQVVVVARVAAVADTLATSGAHPSKGSLKSA